MENDGNPQLQDSSSREIGKCAAILSSVEVGLGSVLHSFHVPSSGHWLSLNQAFWLSRLTYRSDQRTASTTASNVTACLKSLSPAGKRLSPMLAISAQGGLFNAGTLLLGRNLVGASLGAVLLSFWAFLHPIVIYYLIFGQTLFAAYAKLFHKCQAIFHFSNQQAIWAIGLIVGTKAVLAIGTAMLARWLPGAQVEGYQEKLGRIARKASAPAPRALADQPVDASAAARGALRDLFHPLFVLSLALTLVFLLECESSRATLIWGLLRPLAFGFILFFGVRILPMETVLRWMERRGFARFAAALRFASEQLLKPERR